MVFPMRAAKLFWCAVSSCRPQPVALGLFVVMFWAFPSLFAAQPLEPEQKTVIGKWTISAGRFVADRGFLWTAQAKHEDGSYVALTMQKVLPADEILFDEGMEVTTIDIVGVGKVKCGVSVKSYMSETQQAPRPNTLADFRVQRTFGWQEKGQAVVLERETMFKDDDLKGSADMTRQVSGYDLPDDLKPIVRVAAAQAATDPAIDLLRALRQQRAVLWRGAVATDKPTVEASVDGEDFVALQAAPQIEKFPGMAWKLPAQPGQTVSLRVHFPAREFLVTSFGIEEQQNPGALAGRKIKVSEKQGVIEDNGIATINCGKLANPKALSLQMMDWGQTGYRFDGSIYLRWGRREEQWLDRMQFPLSASVGIPAILQDLEMAYDPDRDQWATLRDERYVRDVHTPDWADIAALRGLDLSKFPHLQDLANTGSIWPWVYRNDYEMVSVGASLDQHLKSLSPALAEMLLAHIGNLRKGQILWEDMKEDKLSSWHSPHRVLALAALWDGYPSLRTQNPLERVLDYWVTAMRRNPDPIHQMGKGISYDLSMSSRGQAIAALHIGHRVFKKAEYAQVRDLQMERLRESLKANGILNAMKNKLGLCADPTSPRVSWNWQTMCGPVSIYGQTCAYVGDDAGMKVAQDWIRAALAREGKEGENPFRNYQTATFSERCGMIAVLRGKAAYLTAPPNAE